MKTLITNLSVHGNGIRLSFALLRKAWLTSEVEASIRKLLEETTKELQKILSEADTEQ